MTWDQIREHYINSIGHATAGIQQWVDHANEASRVLTVISDVAELFVPSATITVTAGDDYFELPAAVFHLVTLYNTLTKERMEPEPDGFRGRMIHIDGSTQKPYVGSIHWYVRHGTRVYLRDIEDEDATILYSYKTYPTEITSATDLSGSPVFPEHLHWPLIYLMAANFYGTNPDADGGNLMRAEQFKAMVSGRLTEQQEPKREERKDERNTISQRGYDFGGGRFRR